MAGWDYSETSPAIKAPKAKISIRMANIVKDPRDCMARGVLVMYRWRNSESANTSAPPLIPNQRIVCASNYRTRREDTDMLEWYQPRRVPAYGTIVSMSGAKA